MPLTGFKDQTEQHSKHIVAHAGPVLQAMRRRSANNPVKSKEIETALGAGGPTVRAIISHLRRQGYPIVSNGGATTTTRRGKESSTLSATLNNGATR